jgi:hypothetical protein
MGLSSGAPDPLAVGSGVGEGKESDAEESADMNAFGDASTMGWAFAGGKDFWRHLSLI